MSNEELDDQTLQRQRRDDAYRRSQEFVRCSHCGGGWHGIPRHFPTGETCHGSHEGSKGKTIT